MQDPVSQASPHPAHPPQSLPVCPPLERVISGGQTGVDRAALDAAAAAGLETGGWCPRGRRAEDGRIPDVYPLTPTASRSYAVRTEWNVRDSDGTLILVLDEVSTGTRLTIEAARGYARPLRIVHLLPDDSGLICDDAHPEQQTADVIDWIREHGIRVLNVAGPRGSASPAVYPLAVGFLQSIFGIARDG